MFVNECGARWAARATKFRCGRPLLTAHGCEWPWECFLQWPLGYSLKRYIGALGRKGETSSAWTRSQGEKNPKFCFEASWGKGMGTKGKEEKTWEPLAWM